jgi:hypothetical protein
MPLIDKKSILITLIAFVLCSRRIFGVGNDFRFVLAQFSIYCVFQATLVQFSIKPVNVRKHTLPVFLIC